MKQLPALSPIKLIRAFKKIGFVEDRQKGSHLVLYHPQSKRRVVIPIHKGKTIKKPLLKSMIEKEAGMSIADFLQFL